MTAVQSLTVLTDPKCATCRRAAAWLSRQRSFVPLTILPSDSALAKARFPTLGGPDAPDELCVVSDSGEVWRGAKAWVVALWALEEGREWADLLASPALFPIARRLIDVASRERRRLSHVAALLGPDPGASMGRT